MKKFLLAALVLLTGFGPCVAQRAGARKPISFQACVDSFALVPDGPSTRYAIELLVAIPDTNHPRAVVSWPRGKLGHVFLGLSKTDGKRQVVEYLGFYARSPALAFTTGLPVASRLIDNGHHAYNAGMTVRITASTWEAVLGCLRSEAQRRYSVLHFNCVHYALDAFNRAVMHPLNPPLAYIPGQTREGYVTPNGVYMLLCAMRSGPEAKDIVVGYARAEPGSDPLLLRDTLPGPGAVKWPVHRR
jgi:hypothetical protein